MLKNYTKKPLTHIEQLDLLKNRGMAVDDNSTALNILSKISYYRLSAYWYPFRQRDKNQVLDNFVATASFEEAVNRYEFDRKLRLLVLDAIERIEISLRTKLTYHLAHQYGAYSHIHSFNFHPQFRHQEWLKEVEQKEASRSQEEFIRHFKNHYQGFPSLPVWIATEVMSFGLLSKLFHGLKHLDKRKVAQDYGLHPKTLADWLHVLTYVRNICAHHGRLWNRELAIRPALQGLEKSWLPPQTPNNNRLFMVLLIINKLLKINYSNLDWQKNLENLMAPITLNPSLRNAMGFPRDWQAHPLWATNENFLKLPV